MPTMVASHKWLTKYVSINLPPEQLARKLSLLGLEVERFEDLGKKYAGFIVAEVVEKIKHPKADKLSVCKVNTGTEVLQVVCGAPNVAAGQKVALGLEGAVVPHNQHDPDGKPFTLSRVTLRGVESRGMICSALELDLGEDRDGIMVLDPSLAPGTPLAQAMHKDDVLYEIDITANRGDWMSHIGIARETCAVVGGALNLPAPALRETAERADSAASIRIEDPVNCRRYSGRVVRNVKIGPSPQWMQEALNAVGIRPINNIVDITNYVLMETGQPLHAFDLEQLAGRAIVVKCASEGQKFLTLDAKERTLAADSLMIWDGEKPVAVAGVMGGLNSEITDSTVHVLIESANFLPQSVRRTSKRLGLSTAASQRFERGVDIAMTAYAADRAAQLMQDLAGGEVLAGMIDVFPNPPAERWIPVRVERTNAILGTAITQAEIIEYLGRLQFAAKPSGAGEVLVKSPSHRYDINEEIDLIEEIARVYGYDNIEVMTRADFQFPTALSDDELQCAMRDYFVGSGFNEILNFSLDDVETTSVDGKVPLELANPLGKEMGYLRSSLAYSALHVVRNNHRFGEKECLRMFEIGRVFEKKGEGPIETLENINEEEHLLILMSGQVEPLGYGNADRKVTMLDLKGEAEAVLRKFVLDKYRFIYYDTKDGLKTAKIGVEINGTYAGSLAQIPRRWLERYDLEEDVFVFEINLAAIDPKWRSQKKYSPLPKYPVVSRDLAFVVENRVTHEEVLTAIREAGGDLLHRVVLFDVYEGEPVGPEKKNLAYALQFQPVDRTLTDQETDTIIARIVDNVRKRCGATLRA